MTYRHILILGGTGDAKKLCHRLANTTTAQLYYSQAKSLTRLSLPENVMFKSGGFRQYGTDSLSGLCHFLQDNHIDLIMDITHPYASRISHTAFQASLNLKIPVWAYHRPVWPVLPRQQRFETLSQLWQRLPPHARVFLSSGHQELAELTPRPDIHLIWRGIVAPDNDFLTRQRADIILAKGPFLQTAEDDLLQQSNITYLVSKESGGPLPAKIRAAIERKVAIWTLHRPAPIVQDSFNELYHCTTNLSDILDPFIR